MFCYILAIRTAVIVRVKDLNFDKTIEALKSVLQDLAGLSKNQKRILEMLKIKPDMATKEIAEMIFGKIVEYKSKEYASVHRSLISLEKQGYIKRVQVQLRWRRVNQ
jgi:DNA-binding MarR family transcriptional regulator